MATYYIASTGDDTNDGSESTPWRNLVYAIATSGLGDTIIVKSGTNTQTITDEETVMNYEARQIIGETDDPRENIIDCNFLSTGDRVKGDDTCQIKNITIKNYKSNGGDVSMFNNFEGLIENCIFDEIIVGGASNPSLGDTGIFTLSSGTMRRCIIKNLRYNTLEGAATNVFSIRPSSGDPIMNIESCVIYNDNNLLTNTGNPQAVVGVREAYGEEGESSTINFKNTIVLLGSGVTFSHDFYFINSTTGVTTNINLTNVCYYNIALGASSDITTANCVNQDPLFVDTANNDFRLRPNSPCIGTGTIL